MRQRRSGSVRSSSTSVPSSQKRPARWPRTSTTSTTTRSTSTTRRPVTGARRSKTALSGRAHDSRGANRLLRRPIAKRPSRLRLLNTKASVDFYAGGDLGEGALRQRKRHRRKQSRQNKQPVAKKRSNTASKTNFPKEPVRHVN